MQGGTGSPTVFANLAFYVFLFFVLLVVGARFGLGRRVIAAGIAGLFIGFFLSVLLQFIIVGPYEGNPLWALLPFLHGLSQ